MAARLPFVSSRVGDGRLPRRLALVVLGLEAEDLLPRPGELPLRVFGARTVTSLVPPPGFAARIGASGAARRPAFSFFFRPSSSFRSAVQPARELLGLGGERLELAPGGEGILVESGERHAAFVELGLELRRLRARRGRAISCSTRSISLET